MTIVADAVAEKNTRAVQNLTDVVTVTGENIHTYIDEGPGAIADKKEENTQETIDVEDPESIARAELSELEAQQAEEKAKLDAPKEGDTRPAAEGERGTQVYWQGKWVPKHDFNYRLHLKNEETRKEAQAKIDAKEAEAKALREERESVKRELDELKAKYEPAKSDELGPEPLPAQFTDVAEYAKAIKDWAAQKALKDAAEAQAEREAAKQREASAKAWNERETALRAELPDYDAKISESTVKLSNEMRDAIRESEIGPIIKYHLASNPDVAEAMGRMTVGKMLIEFGKLEAKLAKEETKETKPAIKAPEVQISKAPAPITPLKGSGSPVFVADPNKQYTFEEYKALRAAGKIK
jgi:hypothetical protein